MLCILFKKCLPLVFPSARACEFPGAGALVRLAHMMIGGEETARGESRSRWREGREARDEHMLLEGWGGTQKIGKRESL